LNIVSYCETHGAERLMCAQAGCKDCMNAMLHENKNLIFAVVRVQVYGETDLGDIVQESRVGLWRAIKCYDPQGGVRFSTFAWLVTRRGQSNMHSSSAGFEIGKMAGVWRTVYGRDRRATEHRLGGYANS